MLARDSFPGSFFGGTAGVPAEQAQRTNRRMCHCESGRHLEGRIDVGFRKLSAWGFLVVFIAVGVGAFLGSRPVFVVYVCLGVSSIAYHTVALCSKCGNIACGLNSKSPDYMFRFRRTCGPREDPGYSKSKPPPWVVLWLVLSLMVGLAGAWLYSPAVALALIALLAAKSRKPSEAPLDAIWEI